MRVAADKQTAVGVLVLSLMLLRCDQGELSLTTPWGLRAQDVELAASKVTEWANVAQAKAQALTGSSHD